MFRRRRIDPYVQVRGANVKVDEQGDLNLATAHLQGDNTLSPNPAIAVVGANQISIYQLSPPA